MGQDNTQQSPQTGSVPEWFNPVGPTPTPPKPKKSPMLAIIIIGIVLLLGAVLVIVLMATRQSTTCLDASDYKALTGVDLSSTDLSPTETFYDNYLLFKDGSVTYDNSTDGGQYGDSLIQKIADFYKARPTKPMLITISATYFSTENESLTNQRIATVQSSLIKAGISESNVVAQGATYATPEDAIEGDGDTGEISISLTSYTVCK